VSAGFDAEQVRRLQLVTDAALAHLRLDALLEALLARTRDVLDADTCAVLLIDESGKELVARAAVGLEEEVERGVRIPMGRGFAGRVAVERRVVAIPDVEHADIVNPLLREKGVRSLLGAPLIVEGRVIGIVHVGTLAPRGFHEADAELLQLVADRIAIAIEHARLYEAERDARIRLEHVQAVTDAALEHLALDELLNEPMARIREILAADTGAILLLEDRGRQLVTARRAPRGPRGDDSRLDARALSIDPRPLRVRAVVDDVVEALARHRPADVIVDVDSELDAVVDPVAFDRALSNLLANALRHGEPPVLVTAERRDRHLRVAVEDAGPGVPPELVPRLFDRFERGEEGPGSGLGLAIARAYARAHGGDILYDMGTRGARFELVLPA
jgi:signal transduction histidine kinase